GGRRPSFNYSHHNPETVRRRAERSTRSYDAYLRDGVDMYKPKEGTNVVRILPPRWDKAEHYGYQIFVHSNVGPDNSAYLCPRKMLNKRCPMCDAYATAKEAGDDEDARQMRVAERYLYYILDREGENKTHPVVWSVSNNQDREIGAVAVSNRGSAVLFVDAEEDGYDLSFKRSGQGLATRYLGYQFDRDPTPIANNSKRMEAILETITEDPLPDLLKFYPLDYLDRLVSGEVPDADTKSRKGKGSKVEDEDITEDEEEEVSKPVRSKKRVAEEDDDLIDEEDEAPKKAKHRRDEEDDADERPSRVKRTGGKKVEDEEEDD